MLLKKREEYRNQYNKTESCKMLRQDERVKKIISKHKSIFIYTYPVMLKPKQRSLKKLIVCPVGEYVISIKKLSNELIIDINRIGGYICLGNTFSCDFKLDSMHVADFSFNYGSRMCWGDANCDITKICNNRDWYWAGKLSLELLYDSHKGAESITFYKKINLALQLKYALDNKNAKWKKQLRSLIQKHLVDKNIDVHVEKGIVKVIDRRKRR